MHFPGADLLCSHQVRLYGWVSPLVPGLWRQAVRYYQARIYVWYWSNHAQFSLLNSGVYCMHIEWCGWVESGLHRHAIAIAVAYRVSYPIIHTCTVSTYIWIQPVYHGGPALHILIPLHMWKYHIHNLVHWLLAQPEPAVRLGMTGVHTLSLKWHRLGREQLLLNSYHNSDSR